MGDLCPESRLDDFEPEEKTYLRRCRAFKFEMTIFCLDHLMILLLLSRTKVDDQFITRKIGCYNCL